jgi:bifunctional UDP-N-acetylglucosamine pyrophosphorylase/glucosamine-1-phosphate N-acetyltransferase
MNSTLPKALHPLGGIPMLNHLLTTLDALGVDRTVVVTGPDMADVARAAAPHTCAVQSERFGTAHAVLAAKPALAEFTGDILVVYVDTPLIRGATLTALLGARRAKADPAVVVLGFRPAEPGAYGRLIVERAAGGAGALAAIVEAKDATPAQLDIELCNSGVMALDAARLWPLLERIGNDNAKGEYYLTDVVAIAREAGFAAAMVEGEASEFAGINSRADLAACESVLQGRLRAAALNGGATMADPQTVYLSADTRIGHDVTFEPNVVIGPGVVIGNDVTIRAFSHIEGATIAPGAIVGPFARLRPGADIGKDVHIGNFVEIKNASIEPGAKANHLSYIGDARVGAGANIGAGTITCNYDGFDKHHTDIGAGAFIGSNTALVAPVKVGDGAITGAGSVITRDVKKNALALTRPEWVEIADWAVRFRDRLTKRKKGA